MQPAEAARNGKNPMGKMGVGVGILGRTGRVGEETSHVEGADKVGRPRFAYSCGMPYEAADTLKIYTASDRACMMQMTEVGNTSRDVGFACR